MHIRALPVLAVLFIAGAAAAMQQRPSPSHADARAVLDAALAASFAHQDQSLSPDPPYSARRSEDVIVTDPHGERVYRHEKGPGLEQTILIDGNNAWPMNPATRRASPIAREAGDEYQRPAARHGGSRSRTLDTGPGAWMR